MSKVAQDSMTEAAEEIRKDSEVIVNCNASVDVTWKQRGFSALNGCYRCPHRNRKDFRFGNVTVLQDLPET